MIKRTKHIKNEEFSRTLENICNRLENHGIACEFDNDDVVYVNSDAFEDIDGREQILSLMLEDSYNDTVYVSFMDYKRQALDNGYLDAAIKKGARTVTDLCEFIDDQGAHEDVFEMPSESNRDIDLIVKKVSDILFRCERDIKDLCTIMARELEKRDESRRKGRATSSRRRLERTHSRRRRFESERSVCSQEHARRAAELSGLKDQALIDALKVGDVLEGNVHMYRSATYWFIVTRKTAKRVYVKELMRDYGSYGSLGGETKPILPPKIDERGGEIQGMAKGEYIQISGSPKYLSVWDGRYGWENSD